MDWVVIERKLESLRRSLGRVKEKCPANANALAKDPDLQDILALNLTNSFFIRCVMGLLVPLIQQYIILNYMCH